jgi:hypothetical protein
MKIDEKFIMANLNPISWEDLSESIETPDESIYYGDIADGMMTQEP